MIQGQKLVVAELKERDEKAETLIKRKWAYFSRLWEDPDFKEFVLSGVDKYDVQIMRDLTDSSRTQAELNFTQGQYEAVRRFRRLYEHAKRRYERLIENERRRSQTRTKARA